MIDERAIVNGMVGLLASGGSTNHTLHLVAIARAALAGALSNHVGNETFALVDGTLSWLMLQTHVTLLFWNEVSDVPPNATT